tara:strand:- start:21 stop:812 length:792 start_codon:yes stop_codon:yes gene_type:complete
MVKILVLGSAGMLGSQVVKTLTEKGYQVTSFTRKDFDAYKDNVNQIYATLRDHDYVLNCIGVIKPFMEKSLVTSVSVNAVFPRQLANYIKKMELDIKMIHITTDCVYSGAHGSYLESSPHDALDMYGKSKSLGEPENCMVIRTSIIGEELGEGASLVAWVKSMEGKTIDGYKHHKWNGVTTATYADVIDQIIQKDLYTPDLFHVYSNTLNKFDLMHLFNDRYNLGLTINEVDGLNGCDRSLKTEKSLMKFLEIPTLEFQIKGL